MKRFKVMGLCLAAVFALCAVVAASASAEPTYKTCIKAEPKNSGEYSEKTCATASKVAPGTGKYARAEWNAGKKTTFKAKNIGSPHNNIVNPFGEKGGGEAEPAKIEGTTTCAKEKVEGSVTSPENTTWKTTYKKCEALASKCNTAGEKEGTIVTDQLESKLVYLGAGKTRPGIRVKGLGPGARLAQYECVKKGLNVEVYGETLAQVSGNFNSAAKATLITVKEGPLKMQSDMFEAEKHSEGEGKGYFEWGFAFEACVKEEMEKGKSKAEAEGACFGKIGPWKAFPDKAISLISVVSGLQNAKAPAVQNGETTQKGESMLIEG